MIARALQILFLASLSALAADPPLLVAAHADRLDEVTRLLAGGSDAKAANLYGSTPLEWACRNGNAEMITALLDAGAELEGKAGGGAGMLMIAARSGKPAAVTTLLKRGARVDARNRQGQTALMWAAAEGHAGVVKMLLEAGAEAERSLKSGFNAWFLAAREGRKEVIQVLLDAGIDVNLPIRPERSGGRAPRKRMSALMLAIENGHFELAVQLLENGADPNDQRSAFAPLHALSWVRKPNRGDGIDGGAPPQVFGAVSSLDLVDQLVKHGADINLPLRQSGNLNALNLKGATPFLLAAKTADLALLKKLHTHGADPMRPNDNGSTPFMAAAGYGVRTLADGEAGTEAESLAAAAWLLELGAEVDTVNQRRETAMHGAAYANFPEVVRFLARHGSKVSAWNIKGKSGSTPLLIAQGFRPGNFKPSADTVAALEEVMRAQGVEPPPAPAPPGTGKRETYLP